MSIRSFIKSVIPEAILEFRRRRINRTYDKKYVRQELEDVFGEIYARNVWGEGDRGHFSGPGSHNAKVIKPYIKAIENFSQGFADKLTATDIGCGDFNVGFQISGFFKNYTGCDIVESVIEKNKKKYKSNFITLNAVKEKVPDSDVIFIREVLQHLSNADIQSILNNIKGNYRYLIVTDARPCGGVVVPNLDIISGPIARRADNKSGVVLEESPFSINYSDTEILCQVAIPNSDKVLVTTLFVAPD